MFLFCLVFAMSLCASVYMSREMYFQQCGILTSVDSDESVLSPFKLRNSK